MSVCDCEKNANLLHADGMPLNGLPIEAYVPALSVVASEHFALGLRESGWDRIVQLGFTPLEGDAVPIVGVERHVRIELAHTSHDGLIRALLVTFVSVGPVIAVRMLPMIEQRLSPFDGVIASGFLSMLVPRHVHTQEGMPGDTVKRRSWLVGAQPLRR